MSRARFIRQICATLVIFLGLVVFSGAAASAFARCMAVTPECQGGGFCDSVNSEHIGGCEEPYEPQHSYSNLYYFMGGLAIIAVTTAVPAFVYRKGLKRPPNPPPISKSE